MQLFCIKFTFIYSNKTLCFRIEVMVLYSLPLLIYVNREDKNLKHDAVQHNTTFNSNLSNRYIFELRHFRQCQEKLNTFQR